MAAFVIFSTLVFKTFYVLTIIIIINYITNSTSQIPSWEANSLSFSQEIPPLDGIRKLRLCNYRNNNNKNYNNNIKLYN
jgi:hypothetical protein